MVREERAPPSYFMVAGRTNQGKCDLPTSRRLCWPQGLHSTRSTGCRRRLSDWESDEKGEQAGKRLPLWAASDYEKKIEPPSFPCLGSVQNATNVPTFSAYAGQSVSRLRFSRVAALQNPYPQEHSTGSCQAVREKVGSLGEGVVNPYGVMTRASKCAEIPLGVAGGSILDAARRYCP